MLTTALLLSVAAACPAVPEREKRVEPARVEALYTLAHDDAEAFEQARTFGATPRKDPTAAQRRHAAVQANRLWKGARGVLGLARTEGLCDAECRESLKLLQRREGWTPRELTELFPAQPWEEGWLARFAAGDLHFEATCYGSDGEGNVSCKAALRRGDTLVLTFVPDTFNLVSLLVRMKCGGVGAMSDEDGGALRVSEGLGYGWENEFPLGPAIPVEELRASSTLEGYEVRKVLDRSIGTAWCEGQRGLGVGESLELRWKEPRTVSALAIAPGYGKSAALFHQNGRVKRAAFTFSDGVRLEVPFEDRPGLWSVKPWELRRALIQPDAESNPLVTSLRIEILEVYPGEKYADTCVSELHLFE